MLIAFRFATVLVAVGGITVGNQMHHVLCQFRRSRGHDVDHRDREYGEELAHRCADATAAGTSHQAESSRDVHPATVPMIAVNETSARWMRGLFGYVVEWMVRRD